MKVLTDENIDLKRQCSQFSQPSQLSEPISIDVSFAAQSSLPPAPRTDLVVETESEFERRRSLVLAGVPEINSSPIRNRVQYDYNTVCHVLHFLDVECYPIAVYRLGKPHVGRNRLLKIVLPCSAYQKVAVKNAPRLRFYPGRGLYLRESLPLEVRKLRREASASFNGARLSGDLSPIPSADAVGGPRSPHNETGSTGGLN